MTRTHVLSLIAALCLLPSQLTATVDSGTWGENANGPCHRAGSHDHARAAARRRAPRGLKIPPPSAAVGSHAGKRGNSIWQTGLGAFGRGPCYVGESFGLARNALGQIAITTKCKRALDSFKHAARRSRCGRRHDRCDWELPSRTGNFLTNAWNLTTSSTCGASGGSWH